MADISLHLPSIFPTDGPITTSEEIRYNTFVTDDSSVNDGIVEETEYTLNKAPVTSITEVTGISDGKSVSFEESVDYKLSDDLSSIVWLENSDSTRPDAGTLFTVSYRSESILNRYITAGEQELELVENSMSLTRQKKVIDSATGAELDRIGDLFGVLGDRGDRDDIEYRTFLKSIVKSFISRGTIDDIITALSAATDVPPEDITINEDFINNEYEVEILAQTAVRGSVIEDVTEIADPSGVDLSTTRFIIPKDEVKTEDKFNFRFANKISDEISVSDDKNINNNLIILSDGSSYSDTVISTRRFSIDNINSDEIVTVNKNLLLQKDDFVSVDTVLSPRRDTNDVVVSDESFSINDKNVNTHRWEENREDNFNTEWNFFSWTELRDITETVSETIVSDDELDIVFGESVSDEVINNDTISVSPSKSVIDEEVLFADDAFINSSESIQTTSLISDSLSSSERTVSWGENWGDMFWSVEHNINSV